MPKTLDRPALKVRAGRARGQKFILMLVSVKALKTQGGTDTLEDEGLNPWPVPH